MHSTPDCSRPISALEANQAPVRRSGAIFLSDFRVLSDTRDGVISLLKVMLLDFDDSWVSGKEGCKEACADKPTNMYWEAQKGMPYIVTNVPEQSRLLNFPALIPGCCTAIKWVVTHPADGIVHIAATATTCFLAYSCGSTLYHHWPIDCAFGDFQSSSMTC